MVSGEAAVQTGILEALRQRIEIPLATATRLRFEADRAVVQKMLEDPAFHEAVQYGRTLTDKDAYQHATTLIAKLTNAAM